MNEFHDIEDPLRTLSVIHERISFGIFRGRSSLSDFQNQTPFKVIVIGTNLTAAFGQLVWIFTALAMS
jgi:hypothetical protein